MRIRSVLAFLVCLNATTVQAGGLNLSWDHCYSDGSPVSNKRFACLTDVGEEMLVGSFVPTVSQSFTIGFTAQLDVQVISAPTLPPWWYMITLDACRAAATTSPAPPPGTGACLEWAGPGEPPAVLTGWAYPTGDLRRARFSLQGTLPAPGATFVAGSEYVAFRLVISHVGSIGPAACGGCSEPALLLFSNIRTTVSAGTATLNQLFGASPNSNLVTWQHDVPVTIRRTNWAALKSLYR